MFCPSCGKYTLNSALVCPECGHVFPKRESWDRGVMGIRQGKRAREAYARGISPIPPDIPSDPDAPLAGEESVSRMSALKEDLPGGFFGDPADEGGPGDGFEDAFDEGVFDVHGAPLRDPDPIFDDRIQGRPVYGDMTDRSPSPVIPRQMSRSERRRRKKHPVNWWKVGIAAVVLALFMGIGGLVFLNRTDAGQKILARLGRDASSTAYWEIGEEKMDVGNVEEAIEAFERARAIDDAAAEDKTVEVNYNVSGLLMLASTYESVGRIPDAEEIYMDLYTNIVPTATEAYTNEIRIMEAANRKAEAAELMLTAYRNTGQTAFRVQRYELLPKAPETNVYAGLYEEKKYVTLTSNEGFDIYYTFDPEAQLPEDGILFDQEIFLDEGIYTMRAVAVNGQLVSDELSAVYRIIMPSPQTPRASLAPNTYKQRQRVRLWPGLDNMEDDDITIYYTIDGSLPDADSPIYTGEPVWLPGNYCDLHAVAVNRYGKASNTLSIRYKILAKPYPLTSYSTEDISSNLKLCVTTWDDFRGVYGDAERMEELQIYGLSDECQKRIYPWGYAIFYKQSGRQLLGEVYCTNTTIHGPRGTNVGDTEESVVGKFRDMGQVAAASGSRGLYDNESGKGKIYVNPDGTKYIRYIANTPDSHKWQLTYQLSMSGIVTSLDLMYIP